MLIDLTLNITKDMLNKARNSKNEALLGHLGTHFDVMDKEFPLEYTKRRGVVFNVSKIKDRDICLSDIDLSKVKAKMFVAFYSGFAEKTPYEEQGYFTAHPQLCCELIEALVSKGVSIIGLDFAGIRRGEEHIPNDQFCAENGVFVVENLRNLEQLLECDSFTVHTYPMKIEGVTGLPCRVLAEVL